jgi:hypothetical protein
MTSWSGGLAGLGCRLIVGRTVHSIDVLFGQQIHALDHGHPARHGSRCPPSRQARLAAAALQRGAITVSEARRAA